MALSSQIRYVKGLDTTANDGSGKTGIAFGSVTAKCLTLGGTLTALTPETITTLGTYQAPTSAAHVRIKELAGSDPTKGVYEIHLPDSLLAVAGQKLWLFLSASGAMFPPLEIDLAGGDALLDVANGVETSLTLRQALRLILAALVGKVSGAGGTTVTIRNVGDSKDRITATVDSSGNRTAVTADGT